MSNAMIRNILVSTGAVAGLVVLLLYMQGTIGAAKVQPGLVPPAPQAGDGVAAPPGRFVAVERREVEDHLEWPGTIRSRTVAQVAAKVMARVLEVRAAAGQAVKAGEVLALLDDRDLRSRVEQARSGLAAAEAQAAQADSDLARVRSLHEKEAATPQQLEAAEARAKALRAEVERARDAVREAEVFLGEARIAAPFDGVVAERQVEPGDVALPGRPLFAVHDPARLRLEAQVPESCARAATLGAEVRARIEVLDRDLAARIDEIAPTADPQSRTFLVKASLPPAAGLSPGMFGRFLQPCGRRAVLLVPAAAIVRSGQLETVTVRDTAGAAGPRHVRTGKRFGSDVEVLSGLAVGESVLVPQGGKS